MMHGIKNDRLLQKIKGNKIFQNRIKYFISYYCKLHSNEK